MIKNILMICTALAVLSSCGNATKSTDESTAAVDTTIEALDTTSEATSTGAAAGVIEYAETVYDFGTVKEGDIVEHVFTFKNTGKEPVILNQVSASCGCTTPDYTKTPILPGATGEIKVSFNSAGQAGVQQKIVTVSSNSENGVTTVQLKGTVEKK